MPEDDPVSVLDRQEELIAEYLELRESGSDDSKTKRKINQIEGKLDGVYWERVEHIISSRISSGNEELVLSDEDRLLIDMGLIDARIVTNADDGLRERLMSELNLPGAVNHLYLSEWLQNRYEHYRITEEMEAVGQKNNSGGGNFEKRKKIAGTVAPLFESLPGVSADISKLFLSGGLDEQVLRLNLALLNYEDRRLFLQRRRLWSLRSQIMDKARARVSDQTSLKVFDAFDEIYANEWRERFSKRSGVHKRESQASTHGIEKDKSVGFLISELHFVKTLMPIGALAGGVTRTRAVFLEDTPRVTKEETAKGLTLAEDCDRGFNVKPVVLIAPFKGRGIFEFDRDSLVVSLFPVENAKDSVANAAGNARMLIDSLQNAGEIRKQYEKRFPDINFQQGFQSDYRKWVTGIGMGNSEALDPERKQFFQEFIGPDCAGVLSPPNLRNLGPQTRLAVIKRLEKQIATTQDDANMHHRLGVLYWQEDLLDKALAEFLQAAKISPKNGMVLLGIGLLMSRIGNHDKAKGVFDACANRVPNTIWGVYAKDVMAGTLKIDERVSNES